MPLQTEPIGVLDILRSIPDSVLTIDGEKRPIALNDPAQAFTGTAEQILGCAADDVLGGPAADRLPAEICGGGSPLDETLRSGRAVRNRELVVGFADRQASPRSVCAGPFRDEHGATLGAVCTFRDLREIERIADERRHRAPFLGIIGKHARIREIFDMVEMIRDSDSTVLLQGESGTGKGLFARALHNLSPREVQPFIKVSCAALPETLLESELFGHEKGAFTGAIRERKGRFELADKGTIFLDEIGDLSPRSMSSCSGCCRSSSSNGSAAMRPSR